MKKFLSVILSSAMILCTPVITYAHQSTNYSDMTNDMVANLIGLPVREIEYAREHYDPLEFNDLISDFVSENNQNQIALAEDLDMSDSDWESLQDYFLTGRILISRDQSTFNYHHGHAALIYDSTHTIEAMGYVNGLTQAPEESEYKEIDWWKNNYQVRAYEAASGFYYNNNPNYAYIPMTEDIYEDIADYAYDNLVGISYATFADRLDTEANNCATLVWQAYYMIGKNLLDDTDGTIIPKDLVEDGDLRILKRVNWSGSIW